ncbi:hypothetical protein MPTK2_1g09460 [Marchantia polymorpha subsp. ruderalis]
MIILTNYDDDDDEDDDDDDDMTTTTTRARLHFARIQIFSEFHEPRCTCHPIRRGRLAESRIQNPEPPRPQQQQQQQCSCLPPSSARGQTAPSDATSSSWVSGSRSNYVTQNARFLPLLPSTESALSSGDRHACTRRTRELSIALTALDRRMQHCNANGLCVVSSSTRELVRPRRKLQRSHVVLS